MRDSGWDAALTQKRLCGQDRHFQAKKGGIAGLTEKYGRESGI